MKYAQLLAALNDDPLSDVRWGPNYSSGTRVLVRSRGRWLPYLVNDLADTLSGLPTAASFLGSSSPVVVISAQNNANIKANIPTSSLVTYNGALSITTTATQILAPISSNVSLAVLKNTSGVTIFLGNSGVTSSGANIGYPFASADTPLVLGPTPGPLYGIVAAGTATLAFFYMF